MKAREQRASGLHSPAFERDGCGFGLIVQMDGKASHWLVHTAIGSLARLSHRGAVAADGKTGDGCGLLLRMPGAFCRAEAVEKCGPVSSVVPWQSALRVRVNLPASGWHSLRSARTRPDRISRICPNGTEKWFSSRKKVASHPGMRAASSGPSGAGTVVSASSCQRRTGTVPVVFRGSAPAQCPMGSRRSGSLRSRLPKDPFFDRVFDDSLLDRFFSDSFFAHDPLSLFDSGERISARSRALSSMVKPRLDGYRGAHWLPAESVVLHRSWGENPPSLRTGEPVTRTLAIEAIGLAASQIRDLDLPEVAGLRT